MDFDNIDDVLNTLDSDEKPFATEKKKPKKENLYDSTEITPVKLDPEKFILGKKYFTFMYYVPETYILPEDIAAKFIKLAIALFDKGYRYRVYYNSKDTVTAKLQETHGDYIDYYTPWKLKYVPKGINVKQAQPTKEAYGIAFNNHKIFIELKAPLRARLAAEVHTLLGHDCITPNTFIITYSPNGAESLGTGKNRVDYKEIRSLVFPYRIATAASIPIYNLKNDDAITRISAKIKALSGNTEI